MPTDPIQALIEQLPHRGQMRLIDSVLHVDAHSAETATQFDARRSGIRPLEAPLSAYFGVELIAQSAALPFIFAAGEGTAHQGMIVQVKSFQAYGVMPAGERSLTTRCTVERLLDGQLASVTGQVFCDNTLCCEATLTLALSDGVKRKI